MIRWDGMGCGSSGNGHTKWLQAMEAELEEVERQLRELEVAEAEERGRGEEEEEEYIVQGSRREATQEEQDDFDRDFSVGALHLAEPHLAELHCLFAWHDRMP